MATYVDKGPLAGLGVRVTTHQRTSGEPRPVLRGAVACRRPLCPRASDYLVVLCAGVGSRLGLGAKCCVDVGGASIFQRLCRHAKRNAVRALVVVVGYESEKVSTIAGRPARPWVYRSRPSFRMMITRVQTRPRVYYVQ